MRRPARSDSVPAYADYFGAVNNLAGQNIDSYGHVLTRLQSQKLGGLEGLARRPRSPSPRLASKEKARTEKEHRQREIDRKKRERESLRAVSGPNLAMWKSHVKL